MAGRGSEDAQTRRREKEAHADTASTHRKKCRNYDREEDDADTTPTKIRKSRRNESTTGEDARTHTERARESMPEAKGNGKTDRQKHRNKRIEVTRVMQCEIKSRKV